MCFAFSYSCFCTAFTPSRFNCCTGVGLLRLGMVMRKSAAKAPQKDVNTRAANATTTTGAGEQSLRIANATSTNTQQHRCQTEQRLCYGLDGQFRYRVARV